MHFILLTSVPIAPVLTTEVLHVHLARYPVKPVVISLISRFDANNSHSIVKNSFQINIFIFLFLSMYDFSFSKTFFIIFYHFSHFLTLFLPPMNITSSSSFSVYIPTSLKIHKIEQIQKSA